MARTGDFISIIITPKNISLWCFTQSATNLILHAYESFDIDVHGACGLHNPIALTNMVRYIIDAYNLKKPTLSLTFADATIEEYITDCSTDEHFAEQHGFISLRNQLSADQAIYYYARVPAHIYGQYILWSTGAAIAVQGIYPQRLCLYAIAQAYTLKNIDWKSSTSHVNQTIQEAIDNELLKEVKNNHDINIDQFIIALGLYYAQSNPL